MRGRSCSPYFGRNWLAFAECITDLSLLPALSYSTFVAYSTLVVNANEVPADDFREKPTYFRHIEHSARTWRRSFALGPEGAGKCHSTPS